MDSVSIMYRAYQAGDLDRLYELDVLCFEAAFRFSRASMRRFAEASNARVAVAECVGIITGFGILHVERMRSERIGYIVTLDVDPAWRRQGIAARLMAELERQARADGCGALVLHVHTANLSAIGFYQQRGFSPVGLAGDFYGRGLDAQLWRKSLAGDAA